MKQIPAEEEALEIETIEWATATSGNFSNADRLRFFAPILRDTV